MNDEFLLFCIHNIIYNRLEENHRKNLDFLCKHALARYRLKPHELDTSAARLDTSSRGSAGTIGAQKSSDT